MLNDEFLSVELIEKDWVMFIGSGMCNSRPYRRQQGQVKLTLAFCYHTDDLLLKLLLCPQARHQT